MQKNETVACTLTDDAMGGRRGRWHDLAARAFVDRVTTEQGLRLVFRNDAGVEDELRELAVLERDCCTFADWSVNTVDSHAVMDVAGASDEAIDAVHGMFRTLGRP